jgi:prevent-host-death family protein
MTDRSVSMPEAQGKLPGLIRAAEEGEAVQMARWGAPVAVLVSVARDQKLRPHKQKGAARSLPDHPPKTPWNPGPPCRCPRQRNRAGSPVFTARLLPLPVESGQRARGGPHLIER